MRPGRVEAKTKSAGRNVKSGVPVLSSPAGGRAAAGLAGGAVGSPGLHGGGRVVGCCGCGVVVTDEVCALQCDECMSPEAWKCADCLGLDNVAYSALSGCKELEWRCEKCRKGSPKPASLDAMIADRLGEVLAAISGVLDRLLRFEDRLREKTEVGRTIALECGVRDLEEKMLAVERLTESLKIVEKLESRVSALEKGRNRSEEMGREREEKGGRHDGSEWSDEWLGEVDRWEMEERMKRRTTVIVHGLEESEAVEAAERRERDQERVAVMFKELGCGDVRTDKVIGLGKKGVPMNGKGPRPRPLKLVLESEEMRSKLLGREKNLRRMKEGGWSKVFVHRDLTPMERGERRAAWQEMRNRMVGGERNLMLGEEEVVVVGEGSELE